MKTQAQVLNKVEITYFTDPLCCWSWALEPQWKKLRYEYAGLISWKYRMVGMISEWGSFYDPLTSIRKPQQMEPLWKEAEQVSGMEMHGEIWHNNPPSSSYPACVAVKCAELQSPEAGEHYLRLLREAVMLKGKNIAHLEVIRALADELQQEQPHLFNARLFKEQLSFNQCVLAFREDLDLVQQYVIFRFPTLIFLREGAEQTITLSGYRPYSQLVRAINELAPDLKPSHNANDREDYQEYWAHITQREVQEIGGQIL